MKKGRNRWRRKGRKKERRGRRRGRKRDDPDSCFLPLYKFPPESPQCGSESESVSCSVVSESLQPHGL